MGDHLQWQGHQVDNSYVSGSAVGNAIFDNCNSIGQQVNNTHPSSSSPAKFIWFKMREPILSYTGREDKLNEVHNLFFPTNKEIKLIHQIAIVGLGGVGKSEFARKFAHKYYIQLDGNAIWINAESAQLLIDSFKELAIHIGVKFAELSGQAEVLRMVDQVYGYFGKRKSLFIFDNVESWMDGENAIKNYLPNRVAPSVQKPFVLMTSRVQPSGIRVIDLSVLGVAEAVELIKTRLEVKEVECDELLVQLANLLGCLPLALQQASSYVKQQSKTDYSGKQQNQKLASCIEMYIKTFEVETEKLLDYKPSEMDVDFEELKTTLLTWRITLKRIQEFGARDNWLTRGIKDWFPILFPRKTSKALKLLEMMSITLDKIKCLNPSAIQLLEMMSYISPDDIHLEMFEALFTVEDLKAAVDTLVRFSMITKISNVVSVHRLVQRVVRMDYQERQEGALGEESDESKSFESMLNLLNIILKELPDKITSYTTSCVNHAQVAWEHALALPKLLKQFEDYPSNLYNKAELPGVHQTILPLLQRTLSKYKMYNIYGESKEQYIAVQHLIVGALLDLDKYEDAKSLCMIIYKTAAKKLGKSHQLTLVILNNLSLAESGLGNYSEQMTILEKLIAIRTASRNIGPYHKDTLTSLHSKAACLADMGKYDEALEIFKSTLELKEKHHPGDRKSINHTRSWIALTTKRQGNFTEALLMFRNVHVELVESFGESHTRTLQCALGIGECLLCLGRHEDAMEILKHNMELANENPSARVQRVHMQHTIAKVLFKMEKFDEAIIEFRIVLDDELSMYEETHPEVLTTRVWLAYALQNAGCTGEALQQYKFVYQSRVKTLGAEHPDTISAEEIRETILSLLF